MEALYVGQSLNRRKIRDQLTGETKKNGIDYQGTSAEIEAFNK